MATTGSPGSSPVAPASGSSQLARRCLVAGALLMLLGVALGAFGAHGLQHRVSPRVLESYRTGVNYHLVHALGLVLLGVLARGCMQTRWLARAAVLFALGILCFSGSIYAMTFGAPRSIAMLAPLGGVAFMAGWGALAWHASAESRG
jgi:uncharacterized membrane protein YgdD (TMEM256/DUF423 family)